MRLFLDECLSPRTAQELAEEPGFFVTHPRLLGRTMLPDQAIAELCISKNLVIVTENAKHFDSLLNREGLFHPGLIILPNCKRSISKTLLIDAIEYLSDNGVDPMARIANHRLKMNRNGKPNFRSF